MEGFSGELPNNSIIFALCREINRGREGGKEGQRGVFNRHALGMLYARVRVLVPRLAFHNSAHSLA